MSLYTNLSFNLLSSSFSLRKVSSRLRTDSNFLYLKPLSSSTQTGKGQDIQKPTVLERQGVKVITS